MQINTSRTLHARCVRALSFAGAVDYLVPTRSSPAVYFAFNIRLMRPIHPHRAAHPSALDAVIFSWPMCDRRRSVSRYLSRRRLHWNPRDSRGHLAAGMRLVAQTPVGAFVDRSIINRSARRAPPFWGWRVGRFFFTASPELSRTLSWACRTSSAAMAA